MLDDAVAVHERTIRAAEVVHGPSAEVRAAQLGVARRDVEVDVRVEVEIAARMPSDRHDWRLEPLPRTGLRAGEDAELDRHGSDCGEREGDWWSGTVAEPVVGGGLLGGALVLVGVAGVF